jgi:hypothetical protein
MSEHEAPRYEPDEGEALLQRELAEAHKTIRALLRQLSKAQARQHETTRAHKMTVSNLLENANYQSELLRERDEWRLRAENTRARVRLGGELPDLTLDEARAIHRAITKLHRSEGGDAERLKLWDALLEAVELGEGTP